MPTNSWTTLRTVILDSTAESVIGNFSGGRFDDLWRGIEWRLSRTPEMGVPENSKKPDKNCIAGFLPIPGLNINSVWVLYSYDRNIITVHSIVVRRNS